MRFNHFLMVDENKAAAYVIKLYNELWGHLCDNKLSSCALFDVIYRVAPSPL